MRLKDLRQSRGMTQAALATKANVARGYLAKLERGHSSNPSKDTLEKIADALDVTVGEVLQATASRDRRSLVKSAFDLGFEAGASASINLTMKDLRRLGRARPLRVSGNNMREELRQALRAALRAVQIRSLSRGFKAAHRADRRLYKNTNDVPRVLKSRIAVRLAGGRH
jgi:transcriptional regulator with XRE-family HTH domain